MRRRRRPGRDRGAFTAELAAGLPALMLLLTAGLTAVKAVTAQAQCLALARDAALASARGEPPPTATADPPGAAVQISGDAEVVRAHVTAPVRLLGRGPTVITVEASAVAAREPATVGATR
ncbi:TadE family type IV pilus minor pilin [Actinoplanes sp. NPDC048988]|uniref:TadE family type IV pilus minor pilin n=1 Tax=Actinoplanes sp. NPDC048988 TaxID=3363901 RepID=UPI0037239F48